MNEFAPQLKSLFESERATLLALARESMQLANLESLRDLTDDELGQLLNGFEAVVVEALEERGDEARRLVIETVVPAVVAEGETVETLAQSVTTWSVLLTELVLRLPEELRRPARVWLAAFMGEYARDVIRAAKQAGAT